METFANIDWHPPLNDLINNEFLNEKRFEQEGATYKILRGIFLNPFKDIEDEYEEAELKLFNKYGKEEIEKDFNMLEFTKSLEKKTITSEAKHRERFHPRQSYNKGRENPLVKKKMKEESKGEKKSK